MSKAEEPSLIGEISEDEEVDQVVEKAIENFRKIMENELSGLDTAKLEEKITAMRERKVIETNTIHEIREIDINDKSVNKTGIPTLTRFEKARIMGARALQLSLGAPPFIAIPKTARISLDIAMEELEQRVIPITIRRVFPNGDFQNIPLDKFAKN